MSVYHALLLIAGALVLGVLADVTFRRKAMDRWCDLCDCGRRPYVHEEDCTCLCHG